MLLRTLVLAVAIVGPAGLTDPAAQKHFDTANNAWNEREYATAQRELEAAYAIEPQPQLLYALGQLARLQGNCRGAIDKLKEFLETDPPKPAVEDTLQLIEACEEHVGSAEPVPVPPPEPPPQPVDDTPPPPAEPTKPDALGITLSAVGGAMTGVGIGLFAGSFATQRRAQREMGVSAFERRVQSARTQYFTGIGLASAGIVVVAVGVVRLLLVRKRRRAAR